MTRDEFFEHNCFRLARLANLSQQKRSGRTVHADEWHRSDSDAAGKVAANLLDQERDDPELEEQDSE